MGSPVAPVAGRFGRTIRRLREKRGLGQGVLAGACGMSQAWVTRLELGGYALVTREQCRALAVTLDYDPAVLWALAAPERLYTYDPDLYAWATASNAQPTTPPLRPEVAALLPLLDAAPAHVLEGLRTLLGGA